jgi:hypothetical protein
LPVKQVHSLSGFESRRSHHALVAQRIERVVPDHEAAGSNPVEGTHGPAIVLGGRSLCKRDDRGSTPRSASPVVPSTVTAGGRLGPAAAHNGGPIGSTPMPATRRDPTRSPVETDRPANPVRGDGGQAQPDGSRRADNRPGRRRVGVPVRRPPPRHGGLGSRTGRNAHADHQDAVDRADPGHGGTARSGGPGAGTRPPPRSTRAPRSRRRWRRTRRPAGPPQATAPRR